MSETTTSPTSREHIAAIRAKFSCVGCRNIYTEEFPFLFLYEPEGFSIDTEGCGETQSGDCYLQIHHCPVCGAELDIAYRFTRPRKQIVSLTALLNQWLEDSDNDD